jgi:hypothetical protein
LTIDTLAINQALKKWIRSSQELYLQHNVLLKPVSYASYDDLPALKELRAGINKPSAMQTQLVERVRREKGVRKRHVVAFLVESILVPRGQPVIGCALPEMRAIMLSTRAITPLPNLESWAFGHEIGHLFLGPGHPQEPHRLMYEDTDKIVAKPFPILVWQELVALRSSPLAQLATP